MSLSVIIPTLNDPQALAAALESAGTDAERIVVDGGNHPDTVSVTRRHGAHRIATRPGRGHQMNRGAAVARGTRLLFLHDDTRLPRDYASEVRRILGPAETVCGAFRLRIDGAARALRWVEAGANFRSTRCQTPYGDQALFLRAERFHEIGGFPDLPIMEDFELIRRLRRCGRVALSHSSVLTSSRRWQSLGVIRTTLINRAAVLAYLAGVRPTRIARWYGRESHLGLR